MIYSSGEILVGTENVRLTIVIFMCSVSKTRRAKFLGSESWN
jgi:hypothetical protein